MVNGQGEDWCSVGAVSSGACSVLKGEVCSSFNEWAQVGAGTDLESSENYAPPCHIVVEANNPYRIKEASSQWLETFQFTSREVVGRSFRVCQGPKSDNTAIMDFIKSSDGHAEMEAVLYSKDGDEIPVFIRSGSGNPTDGYTMFMTQPGDQKTSPTNQAAAEPADFVLSTNSGALFSVEQAGAAFSKLCGFPESQLKEEGIGLLIGPGADGIKWKNLLNHGMNGADRECYLRIQSVHGEAISVRMRVMPRMDGSENKVSQLLFACTEAPHSGSVSSNDPSTSPESSSSSFASSSGQSGWESPAAGAQGSRSVVDRSVLVHLQAMKLARSKAQFEEGK